MEYYLKDDENIQTTNIQLPNVAKILSYDYISKISYPKRIEIDKYTKTNNFLVLKDWDPVPCLCLPLFS